MKFYHLILVTVLIFSCSKKSEIEKVQVYTSNDVFISGFNDDIYTIARNGRIIISPILSRENIQTESDLKFEWIIDKKVVSKDRNLDINLPFDISNGEKSCSYKVTNSTYNKDVIKDFKIHITNPFGYGYYFLSVDNSGKSLLSHINIDNDSETVFHTSTIENIPIGDHANSLNSVARYNPVLGKVIHEIFITSEKGDAPHIVTENTDLSIVSSINSLDASTFVPTFHITGYIEDNISHFISGNDIFSCKNNKLIGRTNNSNGRKWSYLVAGNNDFFLYAYDEKSSNFFSISTGNNYIASPINGSTNLKNETIIATKLTNRYQNGAILEEVTILSSSSNKLSIYTISEGNILLNKSLDINNSATSAVVTENGDWYIGIANLVYFYDVKSQNLTLYAELDKAIGDVIKLALGGKEKSLVVTTYNSQSTHFLKGSIAIINNTNKKVIYYPNSIHRCVGVVCCDFIEF